MWSKKYKILSFLLITFSYYFISIHLTSCARISSPTGGPADSTKPTLLYSYPKNNTVNFHSNKIELTFSERIIPENLTQELIVSPPLKHRYKVKYNKNKVTLILKDTLLENETYTLNFRDGITDVTEGNSVQNLKLTFSTGAYVDTFSLKGNVKSLTTHLPIKNAIIELHKYDSTFFNKKAFPYYQTESKDDGSFFLENIKQQNYISRAFFDTDKNRKYTLSKDLNFNLLTTKNPDTSYTYYLFKLDTSRIKVIYMKQRSKYVNLELNKTAITAKTYYFDNQEVIPNTIQKDKILQIYLPQKDTLQDSIRVVLQTTDSLNLTHLDTAIVKIKADTLKTLFSPSIELKKINQTDESEILIQFDEPIIEYFNHCIELKINNRHSFLNPEYKPEWNKSKTQLSFTLPKIDLDTVKVLILDSSYFSMYGKTNKRTEKLFTFKPSDESASISGKVIGSKKVIVELLTEKYEVIESKLYPQNFLFNNLKPGNYLLRYYEDKNENGRWDIHYSKNYIDPEPLFYYKEAFTLKANWEFTDVDIKLK